MQLTELSFSSLSEYLLFCPLKLFYRKFAQVEPEFISTELCYGQGLHKALEAHFLAVKEGKSHSEGYLMKLFQEAFKAPNIRYNGQSLDEMTQEADQLIRLALTLEVGEIQGVEVPITIQVADFQIIGFIDLITKLDGKTIIWDWKTMKKRPSQNDIDNNLQFSTYNLAHQDASFKVVALLKQKKPAIEVYDTRRDYSQRRRTIKTYLAVKQCIEAGMWYPREGWWCNGCPYQTQCSRDY